MIIENSVLLLKTQATEGASDKYVDLLIRNNFEVRQVKTLVFQFKNIDALKHKLKNDGDYSGLIFSSPRCVHAVYLATNDTKSLIDSWQSKHNFAVGEATYKDALDKLSLECKGKESGNAVNLSKVIMEEKFIHQKPLLFPHGNLKTDTLSRELEKEGLKIEGVLVYDTITNPDICEEIKQVTDNFRAVPEYVVFFSPSGLHSSLEHLQNIPDFCYAKLIAIGPVTELAMKEKNLDVFGVTRKPTPEDVLDVIAGR
ncbi:unnamed protein product [Phaedon cochleariae]|uniref:Uroporphyrinogen-III synthase n=1 Tax=Phaedon cochleariae TaxID=80249 RepID=A0A9P0GWH5_PHACE|nr:unnamed protein product [Phaedon cochleariae]